VCCSPLCVSVAMWDRRRGWKASLQRKREIIEAGDETQQKVLLLRDARGDDWFAECTTKLQPVRDWLRQRVCKVG
jgi:monomeric isocitrate dehydrogenase